MSNSKKKIKGWIALSVCAVLVLGVLMYFFLPPKRDNYDLRLQLSGRNNEEYKSVYIGSQNQSMEIEAGTEVSVWGMIINATARWQITRFSEGELLEISIYNGTKKIYGQGDDLKGKYTFPWTKGYKHQSKCSLDFSYTFDETGSYTVIATSKFKQLWKNYSYQTEALTVIVK